LLRFRIALREEGTVKAATIRTLAGFELKMFCIAARDWQTDSK
jgi:hypothetical protein